jgi:Tfp pilus assembly protein PilW
MSGTQKTHGSNNLQAPGPRLQASGLRLQVSGLRFQASGSRGFSLAELLIYVALLSITFLAVVNVLVSLTRSYANLRSAFALQQSVISVFERVSREVRDARGIAGGSILGTSPGKLVLDTTDALGASRTVEIYGENGVVNLRENGVLTGPLSVPQATVTSLVFYSITTPVSRAVRTELELQSGTSTAFRREKFYNTAVLRGSY